MTCDLSQQTIKKVHKGVKSFFELRKINKNAKYPNYLKKNGRYNVIFTKSVFSKYSEGNYYYIRLTLGNYIRNNYTNFIKNTNLITDINKQYNTKRYFDSNKFVTRKNAFNYVSNILYTNLIIENIFNKNDIFITDNDSKFIIDQLKNVPNNNDIIKYFINKYTKEVIWKIIKLLEKLKIKEPQIKKYFVKYNTDMYIRKVDIGGMHMFLQIPKYIFDKDICEVEIKPIYNGHKYELIIKYNEKDTPLIVKQKKKNIISIDPGMNNLMTVFGLNINNFIIEGKPIKSINKFLYKKIANLQKLQDKTINNLKMKHKKNRHIKFKKLIHKHNLHNLQDKRNKIIKTMFHKITSYFSNYCDKNKINHVIMGSNKGWKNKVNMGNKNNRKFYSIPFYTLNNQLEYKLKKKGIQFIRQEESYTSKCDSLANEHINRRQYKLKLSLTDKTKYLLVGKYKGK